MTFIIILFFIFIENESNSKDPPIVMEHLCIAITYYYAIIKVVL